MRLQAVLVAGDRGHSRAIRGQSKTFVQLAGKPMVVHVIEALLHTPEVSEVYVVGDPIRLEKAITEHGCLLLAAARACPIHIVPQLSSLYENVWHSFLRTLPTAGVPDDHAILVVPADIPLVIPEEISDFIRKAGAAEADYVLGLSPDSALALYAPGEDGPGIRMALFNLAEGRFRPNNLHFVRPLRLGNRHYIQDVYENRYQKEFGNMLRLAWQMLVREFRNLWVIFPYLLMHLASALDRRGHGRASAWVRSRVSLQTVERGIGALLRTRFCTVTTYLGGAALDIDKDDDLLVVEKMLARWKEMQVRIARAA
ncbi:MAG: NTP transferase domain-containing protein [Myxococcales bacterium]|nr:NTP transferase domain-containing protein [Myxococcales bacterium]